MKMKKYKLSELISPDYNPRKMSNKEFEKLKRSILEYGYSDPIIVNERNKHIVAGNQRFNALNELTEEGYDDYIEIDCVVVDLDDYHEKSFNIAHNKIGGDFDEEKLNEILIELDMNDFDVSLTGFDVNFEVPELNQAGGISKKTKPIETEIHEIQLIVKCKTEEEQKKLYLRLKNEGYKCQALTY